MSPLETVLGYLSKRWYEETAGPEEITVLSVSEANRRQFLNWMVAELAV